MYLLRDVIQNALELSLELFFFFLSYFFFSINGFVMEKMELEMKLTFFCLISFDVIDLVRALFCSWCDYGNCWSWFFLSTYKRILSHTGLRFNFIRLEVEKKYTSSFRLPFTRSCLISFQIYKRMGQRQRVFFPIFGKYSSE